MVVALIAVVKSNDGKHDQLLAEYRKLVDHVTKDEEGVLMYKAYSNPKAANELIVIERYASTEIMGIHESSAEFKTFMTAVKEQQLAEIASMNVYEETDIGFVSRK